MCWVCDIENLKAQIAEENINVYKVVKKATKKYCVSPFMEYTYLKDIQPSLTLRVILIQILQKLKKVIIVIHL